ncbi:MAG TPA: hypothetical protein VL981_11090 [Candidatus Methylacidiphilales bacterium]|nr:hypothetical protein [Candidatus Methylacidiphilales bacterium]
MNESNVITAQGELSNPGSQPATVTLSGTYSGVEAGMGIGGQNINKPMTVEGIAGPVVTLSGYPTAASGSGLYTFQNLKSPPSRGYDGPCGELIDWNTVSSISASFSVSLSSSYTNPTFHDTLNRTLTGSATMSLEQQLQGQATQSGTYYFTNQRAKCCNQTVFLAASCENVAAGEQSYSQSDSMFPGLDENSVYDLKLSVAIGTDGDPSSPTYGYVTLALSLDDGAKASSSASDPGPGLSIMGPATWTLSPNTASFGVSLPLVLTSNPIPPDQLIGTHTWTVTSTDSGNGAVTGTYEFSVDIEGP